jgi:hypothetical protein
MLDACLHLKKQDNIMGLYMMINISEKHYRYYKRRYEQDAFLFHYCFNKNLNHDDDGRFCFCSFQVIKRPLFSIVSNATIFYSNLSNLTLVSLHQYSQCSINTTCDNFETVANSDNSICGVLLLTCSQLVSCVSSKKICYQPGHICVHHPRCFSHPIRYPSSMVDQRISPSKESTKDKNHFQIEPKLPSLLKTIEIY